ncbi:hypothetical protein ACFW52_09445 [Bacillus velezensis]
METKKEYIEELEAAFSVVRKVNSGDDEADVYFSYLTSFGTVQGKISKVEEIKAESSAEFQTEIERMFENGKLDAYSIADHLFKRNNNSLQHNAIYLEDVVIKAGTDKTTSNTFVLFTDQIIGILPDKTINN